MAAPGLKAENELVVKEGFLCPICLRDLGDIIQLQTHVSEGHSIPSASTDLSLNQLKDLFGRAKQRILKFESTLGSISPGGFQTKFDDDQQLQISTTNTSAGSRAGLVEDSLPSPQMMGPTTSHTAYFTRIRNARVDQCAVETNKLIIRLDKLITETPNDPSKRKGIQQETFERETVPWTNDSEVQYCRDCGSKFSLTKRKHHCRLCGRIICAGCSRYLTFAYARKLTNPAFAAAYQAESEKTAQTGKEEQKGSTPNLGGRRISGSSGGSPNIQLKNAGEKLLSALATKLKRDGSDVSLGSLFNQEGEDHLRICKECKRLLDNRDQQIERRTQPPIIVQMYERLRASMEEAERLFPSYCKMAESLSVGESVYDLESAKDLRLRLLKIQENIDFLSKRISTLGLTAQGEDSNSSDTAGSGGAAITLSLRQQMLQRNVRHFAAAFLQDIAYHTPALPTPNEYEKLQADYKRQLEMRIERERNTAAAVAANTASTHNQKILETTSRPIQQSSPDPSSQYQRKLLTGFTGDAEGGWTPDTSTFAPTLFRFNPFDDEQAIDPLREQILLIKGYIKQAAVAGRLEEVKLLERNLHELEEELKLQSAVVTPRGAD